MNVKFVVVAALSAILMQGCAVVASPTGNGLLYTGVKGPVAVGQSPRASKSGQACATNMLGLITTGDASIDAAKQNGGITQLATVDHASTSILGLYSQFCTVARGE
ncbi:MAG TPA: TRL-like family protein [Fluviicoccus sp.]|nr:TRL-like family protein [Fluviicoccus sp.]